MIAEQLELRFGGLSMQSADRHALGLTLSEIEGWSDAPATRYSETEIPGGDGSYDAPVTLGSRLVPIKGFCRATSLPDLRWWRDAVTGQLGGEETQPFVAVELGATEWAMAQCVKADFPIFGGQPFADFSMTFWMPKPWKYGDPVDYADGVPAVHRGNGSASPVFTVSGNRPAGYSIAGPEGRAFIVSRPVLPGQTHVYDMATGEYTVNGALVDGGITQGDSWVLGWGAVWAHTIVGGTGGFSTAITETRK